MTSTTLLAAALLTTHSTVIQYADKQQGSSIREFSTADGKPEARLFPLVYTARTACSPVAYYPGPSAARSQAWLIAARQAAARPAQLSSRPSPEQLVLGWRFNHARAKAYSVLLDLWCPRLCNPSPALGFPAVGLVRLTGAPNDLILCMHTAALPGPCDAIQKAETGAAHCSLPRCPSAERVSRIGVQRACGLLLLTARQSACLLTAPLKQRSD
jgi:hypothetical protein